MMLEATFRHGESVMFLVAFRNAGKALANRLIGSTLVPGR
jgi:hypothetical protein